MCMLVDLEVHILQPGVTSSHTDADALHLTVASGVYVHAWGVEAQASTGSVDIFYTAHTPAHVHLKRPLFCFAPACKLPTTTTDFWSMSCVEGIWGKKCLPRILSISP